MQCLSTGMNIESCAGLLLRDSGSSSSSPNLGVSTTLAESTHALQSKESFVVKLKLLLIVSRYLCYNIVHFLGKPHGPSLSFSFLAAPLALTSFFAVPAAAVVSLFAAAAAPSLFPPLPCSQPEALDTVS